MRSKDKKCSSFFTTSVMKNYRKDELIILGMGGTRKNCPFDEKDVEIWNVNNGYTQIAEMKGYVTRIFMAHNQHKKIVGTNEKNEFVTGDAYSISQMNMLVDHGVIIYNIHKMKGAKTKLFPLERINKKFNADGFFSNSICYMLVFAIDMATKVVGERVVLKEDGFKRIRIFGVDMLTKDEYELEKGGIEYWIGYARGLGIKVEICEGSCLCKTCTGKPYGKKFFNMGDIDPWKMLDRVEKERVWKGQAMPTKKQWKELSKNLKR